MISQANIKWISELSGVTIEEISGALSKEEEVSLDLRLSGRVITQKEESDLKTTLTDAGIEIGFKKVAKEAGVALSEGEKDAKIIADKLKTTITTSLEDKYKNQKPGEKEVELEKKLQSEQTKYEKLFQTHEGILGQIDEKDKLYTGLQKEIKTKERNNSILKAFPEKMKMDRNDALLIFVNSFSFEENEGVTIIKRGNELQTDDLGKPENLGNIVKSFVEEKQWVKGAGMGGGDRGGGDSSKAGKSPDEAYRILTEKGVDHGSPEGIKQYIELTAKSA